MSLNDAEFRLGDGWTAARMKVEYLAHLLRSLEEQRDNGTEAAFGFPFSIWLADYFDLCAGTVHDAMQPATAALAFVGLQLCRPCLSTSYAAPRRTSACRACSQSEPQLVECERCAGTSTGAIIATYLATRGRRSLPLLRKLAAGTRTGQLLCPGTADALVAVFKVILSH